MPIYPVGKLAENSDREEIYVVDPRTVMSWLAAGIDKALWYPTSMVMVYMTWPAGLVFLSRASFQGDVERTRRDINLEPNEGKGGARQKRRPKK
ncbi:hypothetical protein CC78DRAFT_586497 [Lojkania enalia]|uniref:Uncharacterized protein n=1 Tax=Lojkania enalia TaxID=147567 RepID=A0A9P4JYU5_9PLEO|nr:hypothetical protein CC78DRAFT_586497 [Didymosphaeria enalia]